eukprot:Phypoly_transcript_11630.p1 GENE.Phypoly_transcript_11630~~Phypoly_transcript_11630.p1  ORF type:complete len:381 (+),score=35.13 Phypoly_transcript_11630:108-1145(+)
MSSPLTLAPELLFVVYSISFPFISYYLFDVAHKHQRKEWQTNLICFGFLISILYTWMYILGPRVYIFMYPVLCMASIVPLLKLLALELHCLSPELDSYVRGSFWNYYIYLVTPAELVVEPKGIDIAGITKKRFLRGTLHVLALFALNKFILFAHADTFPVCIRGFLIALQLSICFCAVSDLSLAFFGLITGNSVYLEDIFHKPYFSEAPKEFWNKRWNLVVHKYICKLLYFPLGGEKNRHILLPLIFFSVGFLHELPMFFLPSAKFGYWTAIFALHMTAIFTQITFEKSFPELKHDITTKRIMRALMLVLLACTAELAFQGFGMSTENMATDTNNILTYPLEILA